jgi:hypothetical protein
MQVRRGFAHLYTSSSDFHKVAGLLNTTAKADMLAIVLSSEELLLPAPVCAGPA